MNTNKIISITDLRQSATTIIKDLKNTGDQVVFINNKPSAVLISYDDYQKLTEVPVVLHEFSYDDLSASDKKLVAQVKKLPKDEFVDL